LTKTLIRNNYDILVNLVCKLFGLKSTSKFQRVFMFNDENDWLSLHTILTLEIQCRNLRIELNDFQLINI
jgi:hypothetical protein